MNFIARNKYWILLLWILSVLIAYKFYNNFVFQNNQSILFILLIIGIPIGLISIGKIAYIKNKKQYLTKQSNYFEIVKNNYKSELLQPLRSITNVFESDNKIIFGANSKGIIELKQEYLEITILNTNVIWKYYYTNNIDSKSYYDKVGYQYCNVLTLFADVIYDIKGLLNFELEYSYFVKFNNINYAKLEVNNIVKYLYKAKEKKEYKPNNIEKFWI